MTLVISIFLDLALQMTMFLLYKLQAFLEKFRTLTQLMYLSHQIIIILLASPNLLIFHVHLLSHSHQIIIFLGDSSVQLIYFVLMFSDQLILDRKSIDINASIRRNPFILFVFFLKQVYVCLLFYFKGIQIYIFLTIDIGRGIIESIFLFQFLIIIRQEIIFSLEGFDLVLASRAAITGVMRLNKHLHYYF